jgi:aspartyl-tRNA(Asn)/glutamyl-tRNA(Gln) amidotransferase subunit B
VELKNINSFKHAYDAIKFEEKRQAEVLDSGGRVVQETRGWREDTGQAVPQRTKEYAEDYRYFPEPDLPPLAIDRAWVDELRARMPELPDARRLRFEQEFGLSPYDARVLSESRSRADFYEAAVASAGAPRAKAVANWVTGDLARLLNADNAEIGDAKLTPDALAELISLQEAGTVSGKTAKTVFEETYRTGKAPSAIVAEQGLTQITSSDEVDASIDKVIADNPRAVEDYRGGKEEAIKFLVGQVMRETRGRASPDLASEVLREKLNAKP